MLKVISSSRNVTNAVVLTHNIDFVFLQTVVMSAFRSCGYPTITIFADSGCAAETFAQQRAVLTDLGARYRVVPVAMDAGFRFHPKAVLLMSETKGTLLVGSGNLTFGGWRENAEVWTRFESEGDGAGPFHAFRAFLTEVLKRVALPEAVEREIDDAFDAPTKPWLSTGSASDALVGRIGRGPPLLEQMLAVGGDEAAEELLVCAPYFDDDGFALRDFAASVQAHRTTVLCQPGRTGLHARAWRPNATRCGLQSIDYRHTGLEQSERSAFVHAKFYGLRRSDEVLVMAGSANCSKAALTLRGNAGNAELMAVRRLTPQVFEEEFLGELDHLSEPVTLPEGPPDEADAESAAMPLRILAARFDAGRLLVGYAPSSATVVECFVNDASVTFELSGRAVLSISCRSDPESVTLRAQLDDVQVQSEPAWIDIERKLRATAHGRSLADSFRARVQAGEWSAEGWAEVLDVFCKHLAYLPDAIGSHDAAQQAADGHEDRPDATTFTEADVFAAEYRPPRLDRVIFPVSEGGHRQVHSLQQLLLRWFGVARDDPETESDTDDDNGGAEGEEVVDRPEQLPTAVPSATPQTVLNRRRIARIVDQLEGAMTSAPFLERRSAACFSTDLKVASALLGVGLGKGWLEPERFFELTHSIWSSLFFARGRKEGWLEYRASASEDRNAFIETMRSADLSAALIGWYLSALSQRRSSPEAARFSLAAALAVARLPWLWRGGDEDEIRRELAVLLAHTAESGANEEVRLSWAEAEWACLVQRGQALRRFEAAVRDTRLEALRERIRVEELRPGDVLWQGRAGFAVVMSPCSRSSQENVAALKLDTSGESAEFRASATAPVRALLEEDVMPRTPEFGHKPRQVLRDLFDELSTTVAPTRTHGIGPT